jgi:hypothetical protein
MQHKNSTTAVQPQSFAKVITGTPWAWGFEDGAKGNSVYAGYHIYTGSKLVEYKRGWSEGRKVRSH